MGCFFALMPMNKGAFNGNALVLILGAVHTGLCLQLVAAFEVVAPG